MMPLPTKMRIARLRGEGAAAEAQEPEDQESYIRDDLTHRLILRYGLVENDRLLHRAVNAHNRQGQGADLASYMFRKGALTAGAMAFLTARLAQFEAGMVRVGELHGHPALEIVESKGYLDAVQLDRLFGLAGAPDRECADDLEIACFLYLRGGLTFYQLIDVLEEQGTFLSACRHCARQFHLTGSFPQEQDYACPDCDRLLVPVTSPPGWRPSLSRLPALDGLSLRRVKVRASKQSFSRRTSCPKSLPSAVA